MIVYYLSDGTGVSIEQFGNTILSQFPNLPTTLFKETFVDGPKVASELLSCFDNIVSSDKDAKLLIFSTIVCKGTINVFKHIRKNPNVLFIDLFEQHISIIENFLNSKSIPTVGRSHLSILNPDVKNKIEAVNFSLTNDDGISTTKYKDAELILIGVSRCAKTPTSLYLAMKYGLKVANYPLIVDDLEHKGLPSVLKPHIDKLFGLIINSQRLHKVREERKPNSRYSSLHQCQWELKICQKIYNDYNINFIDTSILSVEEIAARIYKIINSN